jgi:hypothetical protein
MALNPELVPSGFAAITPSDTANVALVGIYVGGTGNVAVVDSNGVTTTFTACPVGFVLNGLISKVKATGTTATNLVGYVR